MAKKEAKYNLHHRLCKSRGGDTNDINCEMIKYTTHQAIHTLFANDIFPEQIERLTDMTSKVLKPEIVQQLLDVLHLRDIHNPEERYKEGALFIPKKYKWRSLDTE